MQAVFEVKSIESQWKPPFRKNIEEKEFVVEKGQEFDRIIGNGNNQPVFRVIELQNTRALVEYCNLFTLKTTNPGNRQIWLDMNSPVELTYLWGENGITKKITFKGNKIISAEIIQETKKEENSN